MNNLIFKILPRAEWEAAGAFYEGSAHDKADGFLHFSTASQLAETLRLYYAGQHNLMLVAVDETALSAALKYEHAPSRGEDFPHLFGPLPAPRWCGPNPSQRMRLGALCCRTCPDCHSRESGNPTYFPWAPLPRTLRALAGNVPNAAPQRAT
jgi:uncharacterized protein (DUF952 family)